MARHRLLVRLLALVTGALALLAGSGAHAQAPQQPTVLATRIEGIITPVIADHVADAVAAADNGNHEAILITIDTPGGLVSSMHEIVQDIANADLPVIVYVAPTGAWAASAGAVITIAGHVAAMAPGTNIGAATPVDLEGGETSEKVVNASAAYAEGIAEQRGRNVEFATDMVREGRSEPASTALALDVVDLIALDREELLDEIDGREVTLANGATVTLDTADAAVTEFEMSATRELLQRLASPDLAFVFLSIGGLLILFELAIPGGAIAGVIGAIMLVLAFFALSVLPVNVAGIILLLLAAALFIAELFAPGIGVFAGGGALALLFAGLFLFRRPAGIGIDLAVLLLIPTLVGVGVVFVGRLAWRARQAPVYQGAAGTLVGTLGVVRQADDHTAQVFVHGELWKARTFNGPLQAGERVRVVEQQGLELIVYPEPEP